MLTKSHFLKKLLLSYTKPFVHTFSTPLFSSQQRYAFSFMKKVNIAKPYLHSFNFSSFQGSNPNNPFSKDDLTLLNNVTRGQLAYAEEMMERFASCKDITLLGSHEIEWIFSVLSSLEAAHRNEGNSNKAFRYLTEVENLYNKLGIKDTFEVAHCHYLLASTYLDRQDYPKAKEYLDNIDRICKLLGNNKEAKSLMVQNWTTLGNLYLRINEEDKAMEHFNAALARTHDVYKEQLPGILATIYQDMRYIYASRNDVEKAIEYMTKGLAPSIQCYGEKSQHVFLLYNELAVSLLNQGKLPEALLYGKKCLQVADKLFPKKCPEIAWIYSLLGHIYKASKDYTKALDFYEKAIKIYEKLPGDYSEVLSQIYAQSSAIYQSLNNGEEAYNYFKKYNELLIKANEDNEMGLAETYIKQASELKDQGDNVESLTCLEKALEIYKNLEPLNHSKIADLYGLMGQISFAEEDWSRALESFRESETHLYKFKVHPFRLQAIYASLISTNKHLKDYEESIEYCGKIIELCEATGETKYLMIAYNEIGRIFEERGVLKDALEAYEKVIIYEEKFLGKDHPDTQITAKKISELQQYVDVEFDQSKETEKQNTETL